MFGKEGGIYGYMVTKTSLPCLFEVPNFGIPVITVVVSEVRDAVIQLITI
jgi:hypothetical protein